MILDAYFNYLCCRPVILYRWVNNCNSDIPCTSATYFMHFYILILSPISFAFLSCNTEIRHGIRLSSGPAAELSQASV
jgi:hypothetical protein